MAHTTKWFTNDMPDAPVLGSKQTGTLIELFRACLIDGFNVLNPSTVTWDSGQGEVTATFATAHGYKKHQIITMSGCTETQYNGEFRVTYVSELAIKYVPDSTPSGTPATGTPETKTSPVGGWAIADEDLVTRIEAAFYRTDAGATPYHMVVQNNGNEGTYTAGNEWLANVKIVANYVSLVSYDELVSYYWPASWNNSSGEDWFFVGDHLMFYWTNQFAVNSRKSTMCWGDINSVLEGDTMHCVANGVASSTGTEWDASGESSHQNFTNLGSNYYKTIAGDNAGTPLTTTTWFMTGIEDYIGFSSITFPNETTNEIMVSPLEIMCIVNSALRGYMPGVVQPLHNVTAYYYTISDNFVGWNNEPIMFWPSAGSAASNGVQYMAGFRLSNWRD